MTIQMRDSLVSTVGAGAEPGKKTVFEMFPVTCPVCHDDGRDVTMGFLDHTLHFGDPIIRTVAPTEDSQGTAKADRVTAGMPLTGSLDDAAYLSCTEPGCGRRFGPYTARYLRYQLLRSWR
jgi:hypothetical protein